MISTSRVVSVLVWYLGNLVLVLLRQFISHTWCQFMVYLVLQNFQVWCLKTVWKQRLFIFICLKYYLMRVCFLRCSILLNKSHLDKCEWISGGFSYALPDYLHPLMIFIWFSGSHEILSQNDLFHRWGGGMTNTQTIITIIIKQSKSTKFIPFFQ